MNTDAKKLLMLIETYGAGNSNPVIELFGDKTPKEGEKFPVGEMSFADNGWRGFYHCHQAPGKDKNEHGHFHLFAKCGKGGNSTTDWTHVVGLSMDFDGQPIAWFAVNQWVTSGAWLPSDKLVCYLDNIFTQEPLSLCEQWLLSMMKVYRDDIRRLLLARDRELTQIKKGIDLDGILKNRDIYTLSASPIDLKTHLIAAVNG